MFFRDSSAHFPRNMKISCKILLALIALPALAPAASYEWTFNDGTLADSFGNGTFAPVGASVPNVVTTNGGTIPHIGGVPAKVLNLPAIASQSDGFNLALNATGPNGGGAYVNQYSIIFDLYSPGAPNWQALFNTDPDNTNDADWYIAPDSSLGIGDLGYSAVNAVQQDAWYRLAFTADLGAGRVTYYVNGSQAFQRTGGSLLEGRYSLYSNLDVGPDVRLFNEGDSSGVYTHDLFVNSVAFVDRELTAAEAGALGGAKAAGILVPEPASGMLALLGLAGLAARRRH
jgi:hypothetical protein